MAGLKEKQSFLDRIHRVETRSLDYVFGHTPKDVWVLQHMEFTDEQMERYQEVQLGIERRWTNLINRRSGLDGRGDCG